MNTESYFNLWLNPENRDLDFQNSNYPPYNTIYNKHTKVTTVEMAVAGFTRDELSVVLDKKSSTLTISGKRSGKESTNREYTHKGISTKAFERTFALSEYAEVREVAYRNGILMVELVRNVPEDEQPIEYQIK